MRSHRNIRHIKALFKKHYPIPQLYWVGLGLYLTRYGTVFFLKWITQALTPRQKKPQRS